jgi:transcriptional regulator with XRE-family HTH domain
MLLRDLILARLTALGWSQSDLSRATNIPRQNLSPILRGERPLRIQHLLVIDHALSLGLDYNACLLPDDVSTAKSE